MQFPTEIDPKALSQLLNLALGNDKDIGRAALAGYHLLGVGLSKAFPDAVLMTMVNTQAPPELVSEFMTACTSEAAMIEFLGNEEKKKALGPILTIVLPLLFKWLIDRLSKKQ